MLDQPDVLLSRSEFSVASPFVSTVEVSRGSPSSQRYVSNKFGYLPPGDNDASTASFAGHKIYRCEDEPIHIPGAIQRFGALIAIREEGDLFLVRIVSENS